MNLVEERKRNIYKMAKGGSNKKIDIEMIKVVKDEKEKVIYKKVKVFNKWKSCYE